MNDKYSIPAAIVIAGALIAGAIAFARLPARLALPTGEGGSPSAAGAAPAVAGEAATRNITIRPVDAARDHIRGNVEASVTLVEYSDTECPFCKRFHATLQQAVREYDGKVRWVYRHFPLDALHAKARKEAEATECAGAQGKFWEYLDRIFAVTPSNDGLDPKELPAIANAVGLDVADFEKCLSSGQMAGRVTEDLGDAKSAGAEGTPHTVILGPKGETIPLSGAQPYESLRQVIEKVLGA